MSPPAEMSCQSLVELVTDYLEGALPDDERARFEEHVAGCDGCTAYLEQMRVTIRLTGTLGEEHIPAEARAALLGVYRRWRTEG
ncbi:MAG TPA: zf-HC2 domain-containing protein [Actinomycetota bacterium]|nr:zf-HC2 domain-containing protein [Actinomycetota bacterium]